MELLLGTLVLRPYVFLFLAAFIVAGRADLGWRRTALFGAAVWPLAWLAEFSSTRTGIPFGLYHYTATTVGRELYVADVPAMDSLSFTFLAYSAFCLARWTLARRDVSPAVLAAGAGLLMMLLDVVIDPLAVRGDRWFLGRIFYYADEGMYFGVPLSNFAGWALVGTVGVRGYLALANPRRHAALGGGIALYYAVLAFNLAVTLWIREWELAAVGTLLHAAVLLGLRYLRRQAEPGVGLGRGETERA
jgi:uncharacterized membrane protein